MQTSSAKKPISTLQHNRIAHMQERLLAAQKAVQAELTALDQGLQRRQQAAKVKALLELMQDTAHVMSKVGLMCC